MAEIIRRLAALEEGEQYTPKADEHVITEDHSISDVLRFLIEDCKMDKEELIYLIKTMDSQAS